MTACERDQDGTSSDGQRNCPKHVEFYSKNKFEKLVHLVCFIVRMQQSIKMRILVQIFKNIQLCCLRLEQLAVCCKRSELASDVIKGVIGVTK